MSLDDKRLFSASRSLVACSLAFAFFSGLWASLPSPAAASDVLVPGTLGESHKALTTRIEPDLVVVGIVIAGGGMGSYAILQDSKTGKKGVYKEGSYVRDARVLNISRDTVVIKENGVTRTLTLKWMSTRGPAGTVAGGPFGTELNDGERAFQPNFNVTPAPSERDNTFNSEAEALESTTGGIDPFLDEIDPLFNDGEFQ